MIRTALPLTGDATALAAQRASMWNRRELGLIGNAEWVEFLARLVTAEEREKEAISIALARGTGVHFAVGFRRTTR